MRRALLLSLAAVLFAQSQPPPPSPRKDTKSEQKNSDPQKQQVRPENNQPPPNSITVYQYNPQSDNGDKGQAEAENKERASIERVNATSTQLLAFFTFLLAIATAALCVVAVLQLITMKQHKTEFEAIATTMSSGLTETTKAANAAKKSADVSEMALKLTQSADVILDAISIIDRNRQTRPVAADSYVSTVFKNHGRTRASNVVYTVIIDIPGVPASDRSNGPSILGAGDTQTLAFIEFGEFLTGSVSQEINTGSIIMRVTGRVSFTDVFGDAHESTITCRYDAKRFVFRSEESWENEAQG